MGEDSVAARRSDESSSILEFATLLLDRRRMLLAFGFGFALLAAVSSLLGRREFASTATFIPEEGGGGSNDLAAAARQFGVGLGTQRSIWTAPLYLELLGSPKLLESVVSDTFVVVEEGGRRATLLELLEIDEPDSARRVTKGVRALRLGVLKTSETRQVGSVTISARTRWPSVSYAVVRGLLDRVNAFNVSARQSRAAAELRFADERLAGAERELRAAEDRFERFLEQNRIVSSSAQLAFQRSRLDREVILKNQTYASLVQAREEARLRRVRDTPVITIVREPLVPAIGEARGTVLRTLLGGLFGGLVAVGLILVGRGLRSARSESPERWAQFLKSLPSPMRRGLERLA